MTDWPKDKDKVGGGQVRGGGVIVDCLREAYGLPPLQHPGATFAALLHRLGLPSEPRPFTRDRRSGFRPDRDRRLPRAC